MIEIDLKLSDGRVLHVYDTGRDAAGTGLTVFWHHGTPKIGAPPAPLFPVSAQLGIRWVSYDRPGYGGSTSNPGRDVATAATCVAGVADSLGIDRFAAMGHSGCGPRALACGALLPGRVRGVVSIAGMAPFGAEGLDWFAGMATSSAATLRAAAAGREAKERYEEEFGDAYDPEFTPADLAALSGAWSWLLGVVGPAIAAGRAAAIDDDLAYVAPWDSIPPRLSRRSSSSTAAGTASRRAPTASGSHIAARRRSCACARTMDTSRSSTPLKRP